MRSYGHITEFAGRPVVDWDPKNPQPDPSNPIYRISLTWDEGQGSSVWLDKFAAFLDSPVSEGATGLVVGTWFSWTRDQDAADLVVEAIVAARERLSGLTALYFGDIVSEECEISWIVQTDLSSLFTAYPNLEYFNVRGGTNLSLGSPRLSALRSLVVESGGLHGLIVRNLFQGDLPALKHLELWLGEENYGATVTLEDLKPILLGDLFPSLKYLGLCDSEIADSIAAALADSPILERIETLDLSMGTLGDEGMEALLASPNLTKLKKLDITHHFCSDEMMARLAQLDIEVDMEEQEEEDEGFRYVAVGE